MSDSGSRAAYGVVLARIVTPHDHAVALDYHEWITLGDRLALDRAGRRNARMMQVENATEWRCNNPDCPGVAWVPDAGIVSLIEEAEASV